MSSLFEAFRTFCHHFTTPHPFSELQPTICPRRWGQRLNNNALQDPSNLVKAILPPTALLPPAPKDANEFKEHLWRIWRAFTQLAAADCKEPRLFVCFAQASFASSPLHLDRDLTQTDDGMFNLYNLIFIEQGLGKWVVKGLNKLNLVNGWKMENWFYMWVYLRSINKQLGLLW